MDLKLEGKRAFISGSTAGIGFAVANQLLQEGAEVIINGRSEEKTNFAVNRLQNEFPKAKISGISADFSDKVAVYKLLDQLENIDILVNNVGVFELKELGEITDEDWYRLFEINVMSGVRLSEKLLPAMLEKKSGSIIFISSESGVNIPGNMIHYGMTKAAMIAVSNGLSKLTIGSGVTVNTILGGPTYSDGVATAIEQIANAQGLTVDDMKTIIMQQTNPQSLLGRFIKPSEVANLVTFLASPLAVAINGACLRIDGGVLKTTL